MGTTLVLFLAALLDNGSFEDYRSIEGSPHKDRGTGVWSLERSRLPLQWHLNTAYTGRLSLEEKGAFHGSRCLTITANGSRDAQIYQPLPEVAPGHWYRFSARLRGGAASLLVYEYPEGKKAPVARTLASGTAPGNAWRRITGFYCPPEKGFGSASIALLVPKGRTATLDDVQVEEMASVPPPEDARPIALENSAVKILLSRRGRLLSLREKANGREIAEPASTTTFLTAVRDGVRYPVNSVEKSGKDLVVTFVDPEIAVRLSVTKKKRFFVFEVRRVSPGDLESLELTFPVTPLGTNGPATNGTWDDRTGICHRSVTPSTECRFVPRGRAICPTAAWYRRHGIAGGRSALVATSFPRFLATIEEMEKATGLPSPKLPDRWGGDGRQTRRWARVSDTVGRSYLFVTGYAPGDLDFLIESAKLGGFDLILFLDAVWKKSAGHYAVREDNFPGGLDGLRAAGEKIHAAGLGFGLHFIGATVSANDAYVTPRPDPRLLGLPCPPLAKAVDADATTLALAGPVPHAALFRRPAVQFPGHWLQIGNEIVRFDAFVPGPPAYFSAVTRGALGTTATAHRAGAEVRALVNAYRCFLVDPDSDIVPELSRSLAALVNGAGVDMVYFDAIGTIDPSSGIDTWYYMNRLLPALCSGFTRDALVQTGTGLGRQMLWHLVPRSASADGHGDLKGYLDRRLPQIRAIRRDFSAADVGWYALDLATERDQLEYIAARCLALPASISVQANRFVLTQHPRAREIFEMLERYERCRLSGGLPENTRAALLEPGRDFRLLEPEPGKWRVFSAEHQPVSVVTTLEEGVSEISVENAEPRPIRVAVEIQRERQVATPADYADPAARVVAESAEPFRTKRGAPATRTLRHEPPLDLSAAAAFAVRVRGDGNGQVLTIRFVDRAGAKRNWNIPIGFKGWRLKTWRRPKAAGFDWKAVESIQLRMTLIPRETVVSVELDELKTFPTARDPGPIRDLSIIVDGKAFAIPGELAAGQTVTLDALGRGTLWSGGMAPGRPLRIDGAPLSIDPGQHRIGLSVADPAAYGGDLLLRVSLLRD